MTTAPHGSCSFVHERRRRTPRRRGGAGRRHAGAAARGRPRPLRRGRRPVAGRRGPRRAGGASARAERPGAAAAWTDAAAVLAAPLSGAARSAARSACRCWRRWSGRGGASGRQPPGSPPAAPPVGRPSAGCGPAPRLGPRAAAVGRLDRGGRVGNVPWTCGRGTAATRRWRPVPSWLSAPGTSITLKFNWMTLPYFPGPDAVLAALVADRDLLFESTWHSLLLLLTGYAAGVAAGLVVRRADRLVHPRPLLGHADPATSSARCRPPP